MIRNRPFYSCVLSDVALDCKRGWAVTLFGYKPHCFLYVDHAVLMLTSSHLHMKSSEVCIKTRSPPASLPIQGQVTKHTTVKWTIDRCIFSVSDIVIFGKRKSELSKREFDLPITSSVALPLSYRRLLQS